MNLLRLKYYSTEILSSVVSGLGLITSTQEQLEWWLKVLGALVAILGGALTILVILRNEWPHLLPKALRRKDPGTRAPF